MTGIYIISPEFFSGVPGISSFGKCNSATGRDSQKMGSYIIPSPHAKVRLVNQRIDWNKAPMQATKTKESSAEDDRFNIPGIPAALVTGMVCAAKKYPW